MFLVGSPAAQLLNMVFMGWQSAGEDLDQHIQVATVDILLGRLAHSGFMLRLNPLEFHSRVKPRFLPLVESWGGHSQKKRNASCADWFVTEHEIELVGV